MAELIEIGRTGELPVGRMKACTIGGRTIALYHTESGFYATDNTCPHRGGPLAQGDLIGEEVTCPWHLWSFDVRSGRCHGDPDVALATHELCIEDESIMVRLA